MVSQDVNEALVTTRKSKASYDFTTRATSANGGSSPVLTLPTGYFEPALGTGKTLYFLIREGLSKRKAAAVALDTRNGADFRRNTIAYI